MKYHVNVDGIVFYKTNRLDAAELCASVHGGKVKTLDQNTHMNITESTQPVQRKFNLELNENELKTLAIIMGNFSQQEVENYVKDDGNFAPMVCAPRISHDIFFACEKIFNH